MVITMASYELRIANATSGGARKAAWANFVHSVRKYLQNHEYSKVWFTEPVITFLDSALHSTID